LCTRFSLVYLVCVLYSPVCMWCRWCTWLSPLFADCAFLVTLCTLSIRSRCASLMITSCITCSLHRCWRVYHRDLQMVQSLSTVRVSSLACCGRRTAAVTTHGELYLWGEHTTDTSSTSSTSSITETSATSANSATTDTSACFLPVREDSLLHSGYRVHQVELGLQHTFVLAEARAACPAHRTKPAGSRTKPAGSSSPNSNVHTPLLVLLAWGSNAQHQLGLPGPPRIVSTPEVVLSLGRCATFCL
jgi:hypothetical protein